MEIELRLTKKTKINHKNEPVVGFTPTKIGQVPALGMANQDPLKKDTMWHAQKLCTVTYIEPVRLQISSYNSPKPFRTDFIPHKARHRTSR